MKFETLIYEKKDGIAKITINLPKTMNALEDRLIAELSEVTNQIEADEEVKCVILTGTGKAFCAGGDLNRFQEGFTLLEGIKYVDDIHQWVEKFINLDKPTIAAVNGYAIGAGFCIALLCDMIIASEEAVFGMAFVNVGLIPDLTGLYYLPRLVGLQRAKELVFTGRKVGVDEAYRLGIVNQVVKAEDLCAETDKLAGKIVSGPTFALAASKKMLNLSLDMSFNQLIEMESYVQGTCFQTEDSKEAVSAFLEKRKPAFKGK